MTSKELYEKHLAEAADGTPLKQAFGRVLAGTASVEDLIAFMRWEMWEAMYSLPPESGARGESNNSGEVSRVTDGWHASACVARAEAGLRQLKRLLLSEPDGAVSPKALSGALDGGGPP